jgi:hypothetical protein
MLLSQFLPILQFFAKKIAFFLKTIVMMQIFKIAVV